MGCDLGLVPRGSIGKRDLLDPGWGITELIGNRRGVTVRLVLDDEVGAALNERDVGGVEADKFEPIRAVLGIFGDGDVIGTSAHPVGIAAAVPGQSFGATSGDKNIGCARARQGLGIGTADEQVAVQPTEQVGSAPDRTIGKDDLLEACTGGRRELILKHDGVAVRKLQHDIGIIERGPADLDLGGIDSAPEHQTIGIGAATTVDDAVAAIPEIVTVFV
ncbi:hypothetical protein ACVWZV_006008 [Bradyrhizobium sp. GM5.1]